MVNVFNILFLCKKMSNISFLAENQGVFALYIENIRMWRQNGVMNLSYLLRFLNMVRLPKPSNKSVAGSGTVSLR